MEGAKDTERMLLKEGPGVPGAFRSGREDRGDRPPYHERREDKEPKD